MVKWSWMMLVVASIMAEVVGERARGEVVLEVAEELDMLTLDLH